MPGNGHVRFGGRAEETDRWKRRHRASVRPYTWRVFAPREDSEGGQPGGSVRWWLWVFLGPDTVCFVMDPTRSGAVLARHAGIEETTGQLSADADGGPRRLVISSDFYAVYQAAGKKADGLVNLYCWAHVRRHFVRAGDANPDQLTHWTDRWLERIKTLYAAHDELIPVAGLAELGGHGQPSVPARNGAPGSTGAKSC